MTTSVSLGSRTFPCHPLAVAACFTLLSGSIFTALAPGTNASVTLVAPPTHGDGPEHMPAFTTLGLAACARDLACATVSHRSPVRGTGAGGGRNSSGMGCGVWGLLRVPSAPEALVELPLLAWAQLHAAATSALHFRRGCRGTVFPLHTSNAQFADSALLGPPEMQAIHGLRSLPFLAYTRLVVTQVGRAGRCRRGWLHRGRFRQPDPFPPGAGSGGAGLLGRTRSWGSRGRAASVCAFSACVAPAGSGVAPAHATGRPLRRRAPRLAPLE